MTKVILRAASVAIVGFVVSAGCGGGGGGGSTHSGGSSIESDIGPFTTRSTTASPLQTVTSSSAGPVFTGISGGNFSSVILNPQQDMEDSRILFSRQGAIYSIDRGGGNLQPISTDGVSSVIESRPTWSPDRLRIAYAHYVGGQIQILVANADGSNPTNISSGTAVELQPAWSPTGSKIAFARFDTTLGAYQIFTRNTDGSSIARLSDKTTDDQWPSWSPDGSKIAFSRLDPNTGHRVIATMNASGSGVTTYVGGSSDLTQPAWSPDGKSIAFADIGNIYTSPVGNAGYVTAVAHTADDESEPTWSPDSKYLAYKRITSSGPEIWTTDLNGNSQGAITFPASGISDATPCWSPPPAKKTLVGTGGALGTAAAGFLFGMDGNKVTSVLAFNSATPDSVTVTTNENPDPGAHDIVFNVAGALNSIKFYNVDGSTVTVLPSGSLTSATGAVVIFNATTGQVATVLPLTASRAAHSSQPGVYEGAFLGVYDAKGNNLAPNGATTVRVEPGTGRVISVQ